MRDGVAGVPYQRIDDLFGVVPGGTRVPQRQRGDPVGVHVLGGPLELGERRDGPPGLDGLRMADLQQQCLVRLDDDWPVGHRSPPCPSVAS